MRPLEGQVPISLYSTLSTAGVSAAGIHNEGASNTTTVSGSITTTLDILAYGIYNIGDKNETTLSGGITTAGTNASGIYNRGNSKTATISGTVKATGASSAALYNYSGSGGSFILDEGAVIIGDITAHKTNSSVNKLTLNLGQGASYAYSVGGVGAGTGAGQWTFTDQDGRNAVATINGTNCSSGFSVCNLVTAVSNGNAEAQDELQFFMNTSMIGSLELGSSQAKAPTEATPLTQSSKSNTWANVYGGSSKRASTTTRSSLDTSNAGLTIGTPVAINDTLNLDLVFNTSRTNLDIGLTKDQEITANSYNLVAVVHDLAPTTGWVVDAYGFVGRNPYDGKRKVMNNDTTIGSETVTASYSGTEVLVGVNAQRSKPINGTVSVITGVNASLSNEKIDAYSESKYYAWDARRMTQVSGGLDLGLEHQKNGLTTFANLSAQRSSLRRGKTANYTNNGTAGS